MIRKRYLAAAGLLTLAVVAAGCGKKNDAGSVVQATPTPTEKLQYPDSDAGDGKYGRNC